MRITTPLAGTRTAITAYPLANSARCKDFLILAPQPSSFWIFDPLERAWLCLNSSGTAGVRSHFLEAIAHSECIERMLIRAALVEGLPTHCARRKTAEIAKPGSECASVADAFSADSVVDFAEFFVIEERFEMVEAEGLSKQPSRRSHGRSSR